MEEVLNWPWRRFEAFYNAFQKRLTVERLEERKDRMVASLWANSNYDDDKGTRQKAIEEIEGNFNAAVDEIVSGAPKDETIDKDDPFFAPLKNQPEVEEVADPNASVAANLTEEYMKYIDQ